jgi:hypothetical protein
MAEHGARLGQAGVKAVLFVHGSIHGTDLFGIQRLDHVGGLKRGYSRGVSGLDALLAAMRPESNGIPPLPNDLTPPFRDDISRSKTPGISLKPTSIFTPTPSTGLPRDPFPASACCGPRNIIIWAAPSPQSVCSTHCNTSR